LFHQNDPDTLKSQSQALKMQHSSNNRKKSFLKSRLDCYKFRIHSVANGLGNSNI